MALAHGDSNAPSRRTLYGISVAAELSGFGISALRLYEQYGLVTPTRTNGGTRRYSDYDVARLRRIPELIDDGVNPVGIGQILDLEHRTGQTLPRQHPPEHRQRPPHRRQHPGSAQTTTNSERRTDTADDTPPLRRRA
jgi:DNA-binding transcriptional MerR regulator